MTAVASIAPRDRRPLWAFFLGLAGLTGLGWAWSLQLATAGHHALPLGARVLMWTTMMVGMMVPPEVPTLLGLARGRATGRGRALAEAWSVLGGYLAVWIAASALIALLDAQLGAWGVMTHEMASRSVPLDVAILGAAGLVQLSPWKRICLERCRALRRELLARGSVHAVRAGLRHGLVSVLSCGVLMLTLLVVGAMNVLAMVLLTAFLVLERVAPPSVAAMLGRVCGVGLVGWGGWLALRASGV
jgi:Predicted metal-binding integral membrane protein